MKKMLLVIGKWLLIIMIICCDDVVQSTTTYDYSSKCDAGLCQYVDEFFTDTNLEYGYNYVTTIPKGALNLTIKQMIKSSNFLALKSPKEKFLINGNKEISESGLYQYHGDVFNYDKDDGLITSQGPLKNQIVVMLLAFAVNPGLRYTYAIVVSKASSKDSMEVHNQWNELDQPLDVDDADYYRRRHQFSWKLLGFGSCSRSCGPGVQRPIFRCIRESSPRYYASRLCRHIEKPKFAEDIYHCNHGLCPPYWHSLDWSTCDCSFNITRNGDGKRFSLIKCVQEQANGIIEKVKENNCPKDNKPSLMEDSCQCPLVVKRQLTDAATAKQLQSALYKKPIKVKQAINSTDIIKPGVWLMSNWNQQCSVDCDINFEHRSIYCDRTAPYTDLCDIQATPSQKRPCTLETIPSTCSLGTWFTSEWSKCLGDCFNLQRQRTVLCMLNGLTVEESLCKMEKKPESVRNCTNKDVDFCIPKWHYSEWSTCSRSCDEGVQRRYAKCLEYNWEQNIVIESNKCKYIEREPVYGVCNVNACNNTDHLKDPLIVNKAVNKAVQLNDSISVKSSKMIKRAKEIILHSNRQNSPTLLIGTRKQDKQAEKLVIAAAPKTIKNCNDELNNCKRINRERLCKLHYFRTFCCLTCYGYY